MALASPDRKANAVEPTYRVRMTAEQIGRDGANPARAYEKGEEVSVGADLRRAFVEELRVATDIEPTDSDEEPSQVSLLVDGLKANAKTEGAERRTKTEGGDRKKK